MSGGISKAEEKNIRKIYDIIRNNSRMTFAGIASKTRLTRQTVSKLFEKMEKNKLIWGYTAIIDTKKLGYNTFALIVKMKKSMKLGIDQFEKWFVENKRDENDVFMIYSGYFHGEYDWIALFLAKDIIVARQQINKFMDGYEEYVEDYILEEQLVNFRAVGFTNPNAMESIKKII